MKLFLKSILLAIVAMTLTLGTAPQMQAQTAKKKTTKTKNARTRPVVYGTEFDFLSTRYMTENDFYDNDWGPRVFRNSIYARHGRRFKSNDLNRLFFMFSWYQPYRDEIPASELNKYEKANIQFLLKKEREWGLRP